MKYIGVGGSEGWGGRWGEWEAKCRLCHLQGDKQQDKHDILIDDQPVHIVQKAMKPML